MVFSFSRAQAGGFTAMVALIVLAPTVLYPVFLMKVLSFALFACAFNLLIGYLGLLSFGHAAYFGLGAYGAGMTLKYLAPSTPLAILIGTLVGGLAATVLGPLVMRRRGIYFAMITIAIGQLFYFLIVRWNSVTGGEDGHPRLLAKPPMARVDGCPVLGSHRVPPLLVAADRDEVLRHVIVPVLFASGGVTLLAPAHRHSHVERRPRFSTTARGRGRFTAFADAPPRCPPDGARFPHAARHGARL